MCWSSSQFYFWNLHSYFSSLNAVWLSCLLVKLPFYPLYFRLVADASQTYFPFSSLVTCYILSSSRTRSPSSMFLWLYIALFYYPLPSTWLCPLQLLPDNDPPLAQNIKGLHSITWACNYSWRHYVCGWSAQAPTDIPNVVDGWFCDSRTRVYSVLSQLIVTMAHSNRCTPVDKPYNCC